MTSGSLIDSKEQRLSPALNTVHVAGWNSGERLGAAGLHLYPCFFFVVIGGARRSFRDIYLPGPG